MKIKTITCHDVYNYGSALQAYALQHYLESIGHDVEIIDYKPWYHENRYNFWFIPRDSKYFKYLKRSVLLRLAYRMLRYRDYLTNGRKEAFKNFNRKYLKITRERFHHGRALKSAPPQADIYVAGSDQIWNTENQNGKDRAYFLDFGDKNTKRISYAASFATDHIDPKLHRIMQKRLQRFDHISVRESTGMHILKSMGFSRANQVLDPVFLLDKAEWETLISESPIKNPYLLVYDFTHDDNCLVDSVKRIAKARKLDIVSVNDFKPMKGVDHNISNAGPLEFLNLIYHSKFVISNSFHATAFSVIFQRPFLVFPLRKHNNSSRMRDFLASISATDRYDQNLDLKIDFPKIASRLKEQISRSKNFLANATGVDLNRELLREAIAPSSLGWRTPVAPFVLQLPLIRIPSHPQHYITSQVQIQGEKRDRRSFARHAHVANRSRHR